MPNVTGDPGGIVKKPRSGRGKAPKGMLPIEPIECERFPVWERQEYELEEWYERFNQFYLPVPSGFRTLNRAFNNAAKAAGEEIERTKNKRAKSVPSDWELACKMYRWEERAKAYWRERCAEQHERTRHKLLEMSEKTLGLLEKAHAKIEKMLDYPLTQQTVTKRYEDGRPQQIIVEPNGSWGHKDALIMAKEAWNLMEKSLFIDDDNYMIERLTAKGYVVTDGITPAPNLSALPESEEEYSEFSDEALDSLMEDSIEVEGESVEIETTGEEITGEDFEDYGEEE